MTNTTPFRLPDVGEGVTEAEIEQWYVAVGDHVAEDDPLVAILTDKATLDISSPFTGRIVELNAAPGDTVSVGSVLVLFADADEAPDEDAGSELPAQDVGVGRSNLSPSDEPYVPAVASAGHVPTTPPAPQPPMARRVLASPSVRRRAADAGIDLRLVPGTGPAGRITHDDLAAAASGTTGPVPVTPRRTGVHEVAVTGIRRAIARQMVTSASRIPHITLVEEVDVEALERLRARVNEDASTQGVHLTPLAFIVRALVQAATEHPGINARYDEETEIVHRHDAVHVGLATQTPHGLKVPVLRHAEELDLWETGHAIRERSDAARTGRITAADLGGSTITVSSLGARGGLANTPIINHPEVAIVGVNAMQVRPHWNGTGFVPHRKMNFSSSFDHRVVDGWDAAVFLERLRTLLEEPALLFLGD